MKKSGYVNVGIINGGKHEEGILTVAQVALYNEFGTDDGRIPERSFMRSTIKEQRKKIKTMAKKLNESVAKGKRTKKDALGLLGEELVGDIKQKIIDLREPENADSTLRKKDKRGGGFSDNPLIDTGQMKDSIIYEVVI
jgi:hypothetical protein